jgi:hypothetical protein
MRATWLDDDGRIGEEYLEQARDIQGFATAHLISGMADRLLQVEPRITKLEAALREIVARGYHPPHSESGEDDICGCVFSIAREALSDKEGVS